MTQMVAKLCGIYTSIDHPTDVYSMLNETMMEDHPTTLIIE